MLISDSVMTLAESSHGWKANQGIIMENNTIKCPFYLKESQRGILLYGDCFI